jgi:hypothetical protein
VSRRRAACRCLAIASLPEPSHPLCGPERKAFSHSLAFFPQSKLRTSHLGYWKIPLMGDGGDITGPHISKRWKRKTHRIDARMESHALEI